MAAEFATVDEYIDSFPDKVQERLRRIRQVVREVVPEAGERISYGMPARLAKIPRVGGLTDATVAGPPARPDDPMRRGPFT